MRQLSTVLVRLNMETRAWHDAADAPWLDFVARGSAASRLDYVERLVRTYGFDAPLEAALAYTPHLDLLLDVHPRFRAGTLARDLMTLGVGASQLANLRQCMIAPFASVAEACGWLYVHERCTLLHERILTEVLRSSPDAAPATSYLRRSHGHVGDRWDDLGQALDNIARTRAVEHRIVSAAVEAFRALVDWNGVSSTSRSHGCREATAYRR